MSASSTDRPGTKPEDVVLQTQRNEEEKTTKTDHDDTPDAKGEDGWVPSKQVKLVTLSLCFIVFIISLDMTIFTVTLPVRGQSTREPELH